MSDAGKMPGIVDSNGIGSKEELAGDLLDEAFEEEDEEYEFPAKHPPQEDPPTNDFCAADDATREPELNVPDGVVGVVEEESIKNGWTAEPRNAVDVASPNSVHVLPDSSLESPLGSTNGISESGAAVRLEDIGSSNTDAELPAPETALPSDAQAVTPTPESLVDRLSPSPEVTAVPPASPPLEDPYGDIELHSDEEDKIPYIKRDDDVDGEGAFLPPRTFDGFVSHPTSYVGTKEPWTPIKSSLAPSVPSIVSGPTSKGPLLRSPSVRSTTIIAPLAASTTTSSSPGDSPLGHVRRSHPGPASLVPASPNAPTLVISPAIGVSGPAFPSPAPPSQQQRPAVVVVPPCRPLLTSSQLSIVAAAGSTTSSSTSPLAYSLSASSSHLHPRLPTTTLSESNTTSFTSLDVPTDDRASLSVADDGTYLEFQKRHSSISLSTGDLTHSHGSLPEGVSSSSLDSTPKPKIDRTVKPMSASLCSSQGRGSAASVSTELTETGDDDDEAPPIPPRPEAAPSRPEIPAFERTNSERDRQRQRRPLPPLPEKFDAGPELPSKDGSSSASSTISTDFVGAQNLDTDIPDLPAPDIPAGTVESDYDKLQIEADGYLAPFGVTGSIALTAGGVMANGGPVPGAVLTNGGGIGAADLPQHPNSHTVAVGLLKKSPSWDIRSRTLPALPPDAPRYNKLLRRGSLVREDGDFDDYSRAENDDFEDETYDKVGGVEAVRLPVARDIELNSEDEEEPFVDNHYELGDDGEPLDRSGSLGTSESCSTGAGTGSRSMAPIGGSGAIVSGLGVEATIDGALIEEKSTEVVVVKAAKSPVADHDNLYEDVGRENGADDESTTTTEPEDDRRSASRRNGDGGATDETLALDDEDDEGGWGSEFSSEDEDEFNDVDDALFKRPNPRTSFIIQRMKSTAEMLPKSFQRSVSGRDSIFKKNPFRRSGSGQSSSGSPTSGVVLGPGGAKSKRRRSLEAESTVLEEEEEVFVDLDMTPRHEPEPSLSDTPEDLPEVTRVRRCVVKSVIDSEINYIHSIKRIIDDYERPLSTGSSIISKKKCGAIFFKVREILQCHGMFQIALKPFVQNWDQDEKIGDVFLGSFSKAMVLDVYSAYVNNFSRAMETVKRCARKEPHFAEYLKTRQSESADKLSLFGLMVKPVQRFPQYILQFQDLLKNTPPDHHDRLSLQLALTQLETIAQLLNERKRESDLRMAVKCIADSLTGTSKLSRSLPLTDRCLVRVDNVRQLDYQVQPQSGLTKHVKTKPRRLVLMNDLLMSVEAERKDNDDVGAAQDVATPPTPMTPTSTSSGGVTASADYLKLKWIHNLENVQLVDLTKAAFLSARVGETEAATEADLHSTLNNELRQMIEDLQHLADIDRIVADFHRPPPELSQGVIRRATDDLRRAIAAKNEELKIVGSNTIQISVPSSGAKAANAGKPIQYIFQMDSPDTKEEWIAHFTMAKLAQSPGNSPCWSMSENDRCISSNMPLFSAALPLETLNSQVNVACVVRYTPISPSTGLPGISQLLVGSCDKFSSRVDVVSLRRREPVVAESVSLAECRITAMEVVAGTPGPAVDQAVGDANTLIFPTDTLWVAAKSRRVRIYCLESPRKVDLASFLTPEAATIVRAIEDKVFFGLEDGRIAVYQRSADGFWCLRDCRLLCLGHQPVAAMVLIDASLWASCGSAIHVIDVASEKSEATREIHESLLISHLVKTGNALWVAFKDSQVLHLYYLETFQLLQDLNVASSIHRLLKDSHERFPSLHEPTVSCVASSPGFLWVGTSVGIILVLALPRLEGAPLISGRVSMCYHAHKGPVRFILPVMPVMPGVARRADTSAEEEGRAELAEGSLDGTRASRESLAAREEIVVSPSDLDFTDPPVATSEQRLDVEETVEFGAENRTPPSLVDAEDAAVEADENKEQTGAVDSEPFLPRSSSRGSFSNLAPSSSRASFSNLVDDPVERDVSFLYKSLMRGAALDVEAAEATCNDAILNQNARKASSQENILSGLLGRVEDGLGKGIVKIPAAQGAATGSEASLYSTVKKKARQSIRKARQSILSPSVMMGHAHMRLSPAPTEPLRPPPPTPPARTARVDSVVSACGTGGPSSPLPTLVENLDATVFDPAAPRGFERPVPLPLHLARRRSSTPLSSHDPSPTPETPSLHGSRKDVTTTPMDASIASSSTTTTQSGDGVSGVDSVADAATAKTIPAFPTPQERTSLIVSGGDGYCSWHPMDDGVELVTQKRGDGGASTGSGGSSAGSSGAGSSQRLAQETDDAALIMWRMKV